MRWTQANPDLRTVPAGETWVGIIMKPVRHVAIASRAGGRDVQVMRFHPDEAREMGEQLIQIAGTVAELLEQVRPDPGD